MNTKLIGKRRDRTRERYFWILKYQTAVALTLAFFLAFVNWVAAYSVLLAGAVYLIPTAYAARKHFGVRAVKTAHETLAELYAGQIWKMALMATGFALIFVLVETLSVISIFATLILFQMMHLIMHFGSKTDL